MFNFKRKDEEDIFFNPDTKKDYKLLNEKKPKRLKKLLSSEIIFIIMIFFGVLLGLFGLVSSFLYFTKSISSSAKTEQVASEEKKESVEELIPLTDIQYLSNNYVSTGRGTRKDDKKFVLYFTKEFGSEITREDYDSIKEKYDIDAKISIYKDSPNDIIFEKDASVTEGTMIAVFDRMYTFDSDGTLENISRTLNKILVPPSFDLNNHIVDPVIKTFND